MKKTIILALTFLSSPIFADSLPVLSKEQMEALNRIDDSIQETDAFRSEYRTCLGSKPDFDFSKIKEESSYRSKDAIRDQLGSKSEKLQSIANAAIKYSPNMKGSIKFVLNIQENGSVSQVDYYVTNPSLCKLSENLGSAIKLLSFGPAKGGPDIFSYRYSL